VAATRRQRQRGVTLIEMMIVVVIVSLLAGITYPSVTSGLDSFRLRSSADSVAAFLNLAVARCEKRQEPVEVTFSKPENVLSLRGLRPGFEKEVVLSEGVHLQSVLPEPVGEPQPVRSLLILPGASFPQIAVVLRNMRGQERMVKLDPVSGVASVAAPKTEEEKAKESDQ
jgi:prepilin-type N-terminal cleavage/methylation domain-containing protein